MDFITGRNPEREAKRRSIELSGLLSVGVGVTCDLGQRVVGVSLFLNRVIEKRIRLSLSESSRELGTAAYPAIS
jgi:hypothetical protein